MNDEQQQKKNRANKIINHCNYYITEINMKVENVKKKKIMRFPFFSDMLLNPFDVSKAETFHILLFLSNLQIGCRSECSVTQNSSNQYFKVLDLVKAWKGGMA